MRSGKNYWPLSLNVKLQKETLCDAVLALFWQYPLFCSSVSKGKPKAFFSFLPYSQEKTLTVYAIFL